MIYVHVHDCAAGRVTSSLDGRFDDERRSEAHRGRSRLADQTDLRTSARAPDQTQRGL
jgi:hypothetical protein